MRSHEMRSHEIAAGEMRSHSEMHTVVCVFVWVHPSGSRAAGIDVQVCLLRVGDACCLSGGSWRQPL